MERRRGRRAAREQQRRSQQSDLNRSNASTASQGAPVSQTSVQRGARSRQSPRSSSTSPEDLNDSSASHSVTSPCVQCKCIQDSQNAQLTSREDDVTVDKHEKAFVASTTSPGSDSDSIWQKRDEPSTCYASYLDYNKFPKKKERKTKLTTFKSDVSGDATVARVSPKRSPPATDLRSPKMAEHAEQRERLLSGDVSVTTAWDSSSGEMYTTNDMSELLRSLPSVRVTSPTHRAPTSPHNDVMKTPRSKVYTTPSTSFFRLPPVSSTCTPSSTSLERSDVDNRSSTSGSYSVDGADICSDDIRRDCVTESSV